MDKINVYEPIYIKKGGKIKKITKEIVNIVENADENILSGNKNIQGKLKDVIIRESNFEYTSDEKLFPPFDYDIDLYTNESGVKCGIPIESGRAGRIGLDQLKVLAGASEGRINNAVHLVVGNRRPKYANFYPLELKNRYDFGNKLIPNNLEGVSVVPYFDSINIKPEGDKETFNPNGFVI